MPLTTPVEREVMHTRNIESNGFKRIDGLWDIEVHLTDVKSYEVTNSWRGTLRPGIPIHDMWVRLTINDNSNESLQIWGNSCGTTGCGGTGVKQHQFDASGNAYHKGNWKCQAFLFFKEKI